MASTPRRLLYEHNIAVFPLDYSLRALGDSSCFGGRADGGSPNGQTLHTLAHVRCTPPLQPNRP